jgi:predicted component of type VI protein secretion system
MVTHNIPTNDLPLSPVDQKKTAAYAKALDTWASLHLLDSGQILPLGDRMEFTLGRVSDAQPIMPDIDLTPYQAYASGVSRLHAVLKREGKRVFVMDLGSSNGTYLNGVRLKPNIDQTINHGDMLALGKLKIQVLLQSAA